MREGHWHFHCMECGFGDAELGRLAADQELTCEVCHEEGLGEVGLQRWLPDEEPYALFRVGLAA
jgi:hypothetical protein